MMISCVWTDKKHRWKSSFGLGFCFFAVPVCVYVNKHGNCGPHLDRKQMQHLPDHFGPGPVNAVLQQVVQSCIDCAYQPKVLLSALQTHSGGGEIVRGRQLVSEQNDVLVVWWWINQTFWSHSQWEQTAGSVWSSFRQPPVLLLCCGSWRWCVVTCSATTFSAASRSATTLCTTGPSQVNPAD